MFYACTQMKTGNSVTWETDARAGQPGGRSRHVRLCRHFWLWLGAAQQGVRLGNQRERNPFVRYPLSRGWECRWQSADRQVELIFYALRYAPNGHPLGLFYLKVPRDRLEVGKPCRLGVRSLGGGSGRWFGVNPYGDMR